LVVERCEYGVSVSFGCLLVVFCQGEQKTQHLLSGNAGKITFAELGCETGEDILTGFDGIFFWSWPGDTADGNRQLVILS